MKTGDLGIICPARGRANDCQMGGNKKCWCFNVPVGNAKLEQALKGKSKDQCLCRDCLNKQASSYGTLNIGLYRVMGPAKLGAYPLRECDCKRSCM